jgi:hypothetical protein
MTVDEAIAKLVAIKTQFGPFAGSWPLGVAGDGTFCENVTDIEIHEYSSGTWVTVEYTDEENDG